MSDVSSAQLSLRAQLLGARFLRLYGYAYTATPIRLRLYGYYAYMATTPIRLRLYGYAYTATPTATPTATGTL